LVWRKRRGGGSGAEEVLVSKIDFFDSAAIILLPFFAGRRIEVRVFFSALEAAPLGTIFREDTFAFTATFCLDSFEAGLSLALIAGRAPLRDFFGVAFFCANVLAFNIP
jgi:hypothetical protein